MYNGERVWSAALPTETHEWVIVPEDEPKGSEFDQVIGRLPQRSDPWQPVPVEVVDPIAGRPALRAAMPWWSVSRNVLVLRDEAIESVGSVLAPHGDLLPLAGRNADMVLFTASLLDDALVEDESDLHQSVDSVRVRLDRGTFARDVVRDRQSFVVPVGRGLDLVLTEALKRDIEDTGDTSGVRFEQVGLIH